MTLALYRSIRARLDAPRATAHWPARVFGSRRGVPYFENPMGGDRYEPDPALAGLPWWLRDGLAGEAVIVPCQRDFDVTGRYVTLVNRVRPVGFFDAGWPTRMHDEGPDLVATVAPIIGVAAAMRVTKIHLARHPEGRTTMTVFYEHGHDDPECPNCWRRVPQAGREVCGCVRDGAPQSGCRQCAGHGWPSDGSAPDGTDYWPGAPFRVQSDRNWQAKRTAELARRATREYAAPGPGRDARPVPYGRMAASDREIETGRARYVAVAGKVLALGLERAPVAAEIARLAEAPRFDQRASRSW